MKWKLKEVSVASSIKYRDIAESEHFLLQETWVGDRKFRIVTKPSIGYLVVCTAPEASELADPWQMCGRLNPIADSNGHIKKSSVISLLNAQIAARSLALPSPVLTSPSSHLRVNSESSLATFAAPASPHSVASDTTYLSETPSMLTVGGGDMTIDTSVTSSRPYNSGSSSDLEGLTTSGENSERMRYLPPQLIISSDSQTILTGQQLPNGVRSSHVRGRSTGSSTPRSAGVSPHSPTSRPHTSARRCDDLVTVLSPSGGGLYRSVLDRSAPTASSLSPPLSARTPRREKHNQWKRAPGWILPFIISMTDTGEDEHVQDFSLDSLLLSRRPQILGIAFLYLLTLRTCPWFLFFFLILPGLWLLFEISFIHSHQVKQS